MNARYHEKAKEDQLRRNLLDRQGAEYLARKIERYWADQGYAVDVKIKRAGFDDAARGCRYDVRSNLKNALPITTMREE
jgi:hypothetical protein